MRDPNFPADSEEQTLLNYLRAGTRYDRRHLRLVPTTSDVEAAAVVAMQKHIRQAHPSLNAQILTSHAKAWARLHADMAEAKEWMDALGLAGATKAEECRARGLTLGALKVRVGARTVGGRIRAGESVDSVIALASRLGICL